MYRRSSRPRGSAIAGLNGPPTFSATSKSQPPEGVNMMKKSLYRRAALAGLTAIVMLPAGAAVAPAAAQIGGIVPDPRNSAQNLLTPARTPEQITNTNEKRQGGQKSLRKC